MLIRNAVKFYRKPTMKQRVALLVGYSGQKYAGIQWNKGVLTIESVILDILKQTELITELNATDPEKVGLKSCSRTDKGVHASFNVVCVKILQQPTKEITQQLKELLLPYEIHLYGIVKLPRRFTGHKAARSRIYSYTVPTGILSKGDLAEESLKLAQNDLLREKAGENKNEKCKQREYILEEAIEQFTGVDVSIDEFRKIIKKYEGTASYHNFTVKSNKSDSKRFIKSIEVTEPYIADGIEYVDVIIHGQSFLLHQIRKMVSFAILNMKYAKEKADENFRNVFKIEMHVPKAPAEALFLKEIKFDDFNQRSAEKIEVDKKEREKYEKEVILPEIRNKANLIAWLKYLDAVRFHTEHFEYLMEEQP